MLNVYTKKACAECMLLKRKLENKGTEFKEVSIDSLPGEEIARIIQESGRKKMPIVEKDGKFLSNEEIGEL